MSAAALFHHLEEERRAVLSGDYRTLEKIASAKADLLSDLARDDPGLLQSIASAIARNQRLLAAAIEGVQTAQQRIAVLKDVRDTLRTYDAQGHKANLSESRPTIERKA